MVGLTLTSGDAEAESTGHVDGVVLGLRRTLRVPAAVAVVRVLRVLLEQADNDTSLLALGELLDDAELLAEYVALLVSEATDIVAEREGEPLDDDDRVARLVCEVAALEVGAMTDPLCMADVDDCSVIVATGLRLEEAVPVARSALALSITLGDVAGLAEIVSVAKAEAHAVDVGADDKLGDDVGDNVVVKLGVNVGDELVVVDAVALVLETADGVSEGVCVADDDADAAAVNEPTTLRELTGDTVVVELNDDRALLEIALVDDVHCDCCAVRVVNADEDADKVLLAVCDKKAL